MKRLLRSLAAAVLLAAPALAAAVAPDFGPQAPLPASKDLYSFADLYRVTVEASALPAESQFSVRTIAAGAATAPAAAYVFSIGRMAQPQGGLLLLAGLAAALWVARRRLGYPIRR
jgi:hypothetical protein